MRRILFVLLSILPLFGQFSSLATTGDGSVVYFATTLRLKASDQNTDSKIFVADESGVRLVSSAPEPSPRRRRQSTASHRRTSSISSDSV